MHPVTCRLGKRSREKSSEEDVEEGGDEERGCAREIGESDVLCRVHVYAYVYVHAFQKLHNIQI